MKIIRVTEPCYLLYGEDITELIAEAAAVLGLSSDETIEKVEAITKDRGLIIRDVLNAIAKAHASLKDVEAALTTFGNDVALNRSLEYVYKVKAVYGI